MNGGTPCCRFDSIDTHPSPFPSKGDGIFSLRPVFESIVGRQTPHGADGGFDGLRFGEFSGCLDA